MKKTAYPSSRMSINIDHHVSKKAGLKMNGPPDMYKSLFPILLLRELLIFAVHKSQ